MNPRKKFVEVDGRIKRIRHRHTSHRTREAKDLARRKELNTRGRWGVPSTAYADVNPWKPWDGGGWYKAPRWYRNRLEKKFRAKVRDLMHHERYDDLPATRRKDADWNWN